MGARGLLPKGVDVAPAPRAVPGPPKGMSAPAKRYWREVMPYLLDLGLYSEMDESALRAGCENYALLLKASAAVHADPSDSAAGRLWHRCQASHREFCKAFGLDPASRRRLTLARSEERSAEEEVEEFLFGDGG